MPELAFVEPANDPPAVTLASWGAELARRARTQRHLVVNPMSGSDVTRAAVDACLQRMTGGDTFIFFGHGHWTSLEGSETLVDRSNVASFAGKHAIAIACEAAQSLGEDAVTAGASFFLGFNHTLLWLANAPYVDRFREAVLDALEPLIVGGSAEAAEQALRAGFDAVFDYYRFQTPQDDPNVAVAWTFADWDARHVKLCLPPPPTPPGPIKVKKRHFILDSVVVPRRQGDSSVSSETAEDPRDQPGPDLPPGKGFGGVVV